MLLNKISEATKLINECEDLKYTQKKLQGYNDFSDLMKKRRTTIIQYLNVAKLLVSYDNTYFETPDLSSFAKNIDIILKKFEEEESLPTGHFDYIFKTSEARLVHLKDLWKLHVDNKSSTTRNTLRSVSGLLDDKTKVEETLQQLDIIKFKLPNQEGDLKKLNDLLDVAKDIVKELGADKEIEDFLTMVVNKKATIEDITPNILEWLKKKNFMDMLFIRFKE